MIIKGTKKKKKKHLGIVNFDKREVSKFRVHIKNCVRKKMFQKFMSETGLTANINKTAAKIERQKQLHS